MPTIIDETFFVGDISIQNTGSESVKLKISEFIDQYYKECLIGILGYPLYKALINETNGTFVRQIFGNLIRNDEQIKVGTTEGFNENENYFVFDGTLGKPDYRGYEIVPSELTGRGILKKGIDYSWNKTTGRFELIIQNDVFAIDTVYNIHFQPSPVYVSTEGSGEPVSQRMIDLLYGKEFTNYKGELDYFEGLLYGSPEINKSLIADYVFYFYIKSNFSQFSGVNVKLQKSEKGTLISPVDKMLTAWNRFSEKTKQMCSFLWSMNNKVQIPVYPEFTNSFLSKSLNFSKRNNFFGI